MPTKRHERRPIEFLNRQQIDALLGAAHLSTWIGRRDQTLLLLTVQTGLRVPELIGLTCQDVVLGTGAHVRCQGKGRKHRCTPLRPETAKMLEAARKAREPTALEQSGSIDCAELERARHGMDTTTKGTAP